jgi:hypothetical protein
LVFMIGQDEGGLANDAAIVHLPGHVNARRSEFAEVTRIEGFCRSGGCRSEPQIGFPDLARA